ncbi:dTDP-4-dehydrorhamnose 3,5-epimerase family protein [Gynuella sp.]|uniref:dTDP-4-dehydrorhamnose 3,5-epimerase family protein n=1 Tax=Gynuella sp. TaxID=2969146 RepID=UPI003D0E5400
MIEGLRWIERKTFNNGSELSYVVPFSNIRPTNIVYHGHSPFSYQQYGIHLGQADVLTFLGDESKKITAYFIDCRMDSPTFRRRYSEEFSPSEHRTLYVPPGVAHSFSGLEYVYTINSYQILLPAPDKIDSTEWTPENDIVNIPIDIEDGDIPAIQANTEKASSQLYQLISSYQETQMSHDNLLHPEERKVTLGSGEELKLIFRKQSENMAKPAPVEEDLGIQGLKIKRLKSVKTGEESKIVSIVGGCPYYVVSHHGDSYNFDSYGMHKGQEDHLTFLGDNKIIKAFFVDCREGSETLHKKIQIDIPASPDHELIIPPGVAHAFNGLEGVYTFNRPVIYLNQHEHYVPAHDTHEWSIHEKNPPVIKPNIIPADHDFYIALAQRQSDELEQSSSSLGAPKAIETTDEFGNPVRVLLRKSVG